MSRERALWLSADWITEALQSDPPQRLTCEQHCMDTTGCSKVKRSSQDFSHVLASSSHENDGLHHAQKE